MTIRALFTPIHRRSDPQDTVAGLLALSKLGQELSSSHYDLTISVWTDQAERKDIRINSQNFMMMQKHVVSESRLPRRRFSGPLMPLISLGAVRSC